MPAQNYTNNPLLTSYYQNRDYAIYLPAVKSSGDIYHIAAYIILCRHFNWHEPKVYIAYDEYDTFKPASRGLNFLQLLLGNKTKAELVDLSNKLKTTQQNPRDKKTRETILTQQNTSAINQKGTTALIQRAMLGYGITNIHNVLRTAFLDREPIKAVVDSLKSWLDEKTSHLKKQLQTQVRPFVVIHHRLSTGSNDQQCLTDQELKETKTILESQGLAVYILIISGVELSEKQKLNMRDNLGLQSDDDLIEVFKDADGQYAKFYHMHLLDSIAALPGFKGMIGSTSGTFDVAAFMGIKCLNIHKFKAPSESQPKAIMKHQDFRITLQSVFMSICASIDPATLFYWLNILPIAFLYGHSKMPIEAKPTTQIPEPHKHIERLGFNCAYYNAGKNKLTIENFNQHFSKQVEYLKTQSEVAKIITAKSNLEHEELESRNDIRAEFEAELECLNRSQVSDPINRPRYL